MAAAELEKILRKLLVPDNTIIQQATFELNAAFKKPEDVVPALVQLLQHSTEPTIRQYCAILLRRRVVKQWKSLNDQVKESLKSILLECTAKESVAFVCTSICQVIGSAARHDLPNNCWPQLLQYISQCIQSSVMQQREVGFTLLRAVCEGASEQLKPWYRDLFPAFKGGISDKESKINAYLAIRCLCPLVQFFGTDEEALLKPLLGEIMEVVKVLIKQDEEKANEALDIFDRLVEIEVGIIVPYVKTLVEFCMQIASCDDLEDSIRIKALYLISWACRRKSKMLLKTKMLQPLITMILKIMSREEEEQDDENEETNSLQNVAGQALDLIALNSSPAKVMPMLMEILTSMFASANKHERKAGYIALGELAEGCCDYIRNRHLESAIDTAMTGLADGEIVVKNAALFALGQYAEHIQPEVSQHHAKVIPVLINYLREIYSNQQTTHASVTKIFYALEKFTEGLDKEVVLSYAENLMEVFLSLLKLSQNQHVTELAISAIGALAMSAQEHLSKYFGVIMEHLKVILVQPVTIENTDVLAQTVDTLGALARTVSKETFLPVSEECMKFAINLIQDCEDPDLRRCTYGLFASVSTVLKENMCVYLSDIIPVMMLSLKSTEGIEAQTTEDPSFLVDDDVCEEDLNDEEDEDEEDEGAMGYTVENAYMDEKEDTINSLAELAENIGKPATIYVEEIFKEIFLLIDHPHENVRTASVTACIRLTSVVYKLLKENHEADLSPAHACVNRSLPTAINVMNTDDERAVVTATVEALADMLKTMQEDTFTDKKYVDELAQAILNIFQAKTHCQQFEDESETASVEGDGESELDILLVEQTGELLPQLASAIGGRAFTVYFNALLPEIMKRSKNTALVAERSFAAGTVAEITQAMKDAIADYVQAMVPWLMILLQDKDDEVRSNSAFALGLLCEHGGQPSQGFYVNILQGLFTLLQSEQQPALVQDNICGAVCRMVLAGKHLLPMDQVMMVLVEALPIREDKSEANTVVSCFIELYREDASALAPYLEKLAPWFAECFKNEESGLKEDTRSNLRLLLSDLVTKLPNLVI